jgi:hypothetical protein
MRTSLEATLGFSSTRKTIDMPQVRAILLGPEKKVFKNS